MADEQAEHGDNRREEYQDYCRGVLFSSKADSSSLQVRRVRFKARLNDSDPS